MGYDVRVPPKKVSAAPRVPDPDQVIVRLDREGRMYINKEMISKELFPARLRTAMTGRSEKLVFFAADGDVLFDDVAKFMDLVRDNGAANIGIVFDDLSGPVAAETAVGAAPTP
jgi:biopolymer transport protein ExbD